MSSTRFLVLALICLAPLRAAVWQSSVPVGEARAYRWIPEDRAHLRGVVLANHNMVEQGIRETARNEVTR